jgi:hypothetical protein
MPILFWIVPFIIAGGIMWFVANQTAPIGHEIPLSRAIVAIIVMGVFNGASNHWLKPIIGDWYLAVSFIADTVAVMATLQLSFWRSLLAVFIYFVVIFIAVLTIAFIAGSGKPSSGVKRAAAMTPARHEAIIGNHFTYPIINQQLSRFTCGPKVC